MRNDLILLKAVKTKTEKITLVFTQKIENTTKGNSSASDITLALNASDARFSENGTGNYHFFTGAEPSDILREFGVDVSALAGKPEKSELPINKVNPTMDSFPDAVLALQVTEIKESDVTSVKLKDALAKGLQKWKINPTSGATLKSGGQRVTIVTSLVHGEPTHTFHKNDTVDTPQVSVVAPEVVTSAEPAV